MVETQLDSLPPTADAAARAAHYAEVFQRLELLLEGEDDWVAALSTAACELHHAFGYFHWTGWYRVAVPTAAAAAAGGTPPQLVVGPYQGLLGCLRIPYSKGVCGTAAASLTTQLVPDVLAHPNHIACAASTRSEVVVPLRAGDGRLMAVLDVDSDLPAAFTEVDAAQLERLCAWLGRRHWRGAP